MFIYKCIILFGFNILNCIFLIFFKGVLELVVYVIVYNWCKIIMCDFFFVKIVW